VIVMMDIMIMLLIKNVKIVFINVIYVVCHLMYVILVQILKIEIKLKIVNV